MGYKKFICKYCGKTLYYNQPLKVDRSYWKDGRRIKKIKTIYAGERCSCKEATKEWQRLDNLSKVLSKALTA